jgi:Arc/MetJ family transcription regulator
MRLQVVMTEAEHGEIRAVAERHRMNVSEWVRTVLRDAREREVRAGAPAVRESGASYGAAPPFPGRVRLEVDVKRDLIEAVQERYHLPTPRAAVEYALSRAAVQPMSKEEALAMQGKGWEGDLHALRPADTGEPL